MGFRPCPSVLRCRSRALARVSKSPRRGISDHFFGVPERGVASDESMRTLEVYSIVVVATKSPSPNRKTPGHQGQEALLHSGASWPGGRISSTTTKVPVAVRVKVPARYLPESSGPSSTNSAFPRGSPC